jgi:type I restriction enzyme S subunit
MNKENENRVLPCGWNWVKLGEICEIIAGQSPPGSTYRNSPEGIPFFQGVSGRVNW